MAVRDVREYYAKCIINKIELQEDLKDFDEAFKAGHITEEKLEDIKLEISRMQENIDRLAYVLYLLELPNRKSKQTKYKQTTMDIEAGFDKLRASEKCILEENKTIQTHIRARLKDITDTKTDN